MSALAGITMMTIVTLTTLVLGLSAMNVFVIRDAAIDAAQQVALAKSHSKNDYLLKLIQKRVPSMVSVQVTELSRGATAGYLVEGEMPGFGYLSNLTKVSIQVTATSEALS